MELGIGNWELETDSVSPYKGGSKGGVKNFS
jgi:hypothetical protein